ELISKHTRPIRKKMVPIDCAAGVQLHLALLWHICLHQYKGRGILLHEPFISDISACVPSAKAEVQKRGAVNNDPKLQIHRQFQKIVTVVSGRFPEVFDGPKSKTRFDWSAADIVTPTLLATDVLSLCYHESPMFASGVLMGVSSPCPPCTGLGHKGLMDIAEHLGLGRDQAAFDAVLPPAQGVKARVLAFRKGVLRLEGGKEPVSDIHSRALCAIAISRVCTECL
ncbi:hypothetical protein KIPB_009801, partial [Kipferlia bialata]